MKQHSSQFDYTFHMAPFPFRTLHESAVELSITPQRMSRLLRILKVPVYRQGYTIFLDSKAINRIRRAVEKKEVRPGRKKQP